ncbi:MAG TPA: ABC transporter permease [Candidatus Limnocylindrales bacterium]|nr:ABC transporter permease [Candidatus Limnocylindrales bacterium]
MWRWFKSKIRAMLRKSDLDAEMDEEMRAHIEMRTQQNTQAGMPPEEARFAALRQFGWVESIKETCREERGVAWLEHLLQDVRYGSRMLRKNPGFTAAAILTLALGIGLNTAIFSVAYGVLWRPLPYPNADRLVILSSAQRTETGVKTFWTWAPVTYEALRPHVTTLDFLAAYNSIDAQLSGRGEPLQLHALEVGPNFFATLGVNPARGRAFLTGAGAPDDDRTAIVSDRLWRTSLKADPAIVGQSITIDGLARTVVGVLPPDFSFRPVVQIGALPEADIFLPNRWPGDTGKDAFLFLLGRMKPGVTRERAAAELTPLVNDPSIVPPGALAPEGVLAPNVRTRARAVGLQEHGTESVRRLLLILLGAVSFVLLIACVNVANLQMARLTARAGELSVRIALGAGNGRIVRQLLTEAVVMSLLGGSLGVMLAQIAIHVALPLVPQSALPRLAGIVIDARVMTFCLGLSLVSTLLTGLVPALRVSWAALGEGHALHAGETRTTGDRQGERLRTLLVAAQIAMTLVLLTGAGLLIHSFVRLASVSPGFTLSARDGVVQTVKVTLPERVYDEPKRIHAFARSVLDRIQYLPGVKSASLINSAPFGMMFIQGDFDIEGQPKPTLFAGTPKIDAGYFKTMGIPLLAGRDFTTQDTPEAPKVAIVSERIVREYFPGGPGAALGRRVRLDDRGEWLTVVGVVADIRQMGLDRQVQPMIYVPFQQDSSWFVRFVSFVARTATPASVVKGIRAEIRRVAPDLPIESTLTMDEAVAASVASPRFRMVLLVLFAMSATLIATCGIYGLMDYAVTQRRREIGVRMALGAKRRDVLRLVLTRALRIVVVGLIVGLAGAAALTRVLQRFLFGVTPTDPIAFTIVTLLLMAVGLLAAWLPARRATRIDPCAALRAE